MLKPKVFTLGLVGPFMVAHVTDQDTVEAITAAEAVITAVADIMGAGITAATGGGTADTVGDITTDRITEVGITGVAGTEVGDTIITGMAGSGFACQRDPNPVKV